MSSPQFDMGHMMGLNTGRDEARTLLTAIAQPTIDRLVKEAKDGASVLKVNRLEWMVVAYSMSRSLEPREPEPGANFYGIPLEISDD